MNDKLGAIFRNGKQVGGFLNWHEETILNESSDKEGNALHKFANWTLSAESYWLFDSVNRDITIRLYLKGRGYWEGKGYISSPTRKVYDTLIHEPLEIVGEGVLEGKE